MELEALRRVFLEDLKSDNLAEETRQKYDRSTARLLSFLKTFHHIELTDQLTKDAKPALENYLDRLAKAVNQKTGEAIIEQTRFHASRQIKRFLHWLAVNDHVAVDFSHIFTWELRQKHIIKNVLTEGQVGEILALPDTGTYIGFRDKVILELFYNTGLRRSEVAGLEIYDLNFEEHVVFVRQGKGKKDRLVPMGHYLERFLKEYLEKVRPAMLTVADSAALFVNQRGEAFRKKNFECFLATYQRRTAMKFSCHSFRHSFATHLLKHGAGLVHIQKMLGHSTPSSTEIYTKVYPLDLKKIILEKHPRSTQRLAEEEIQIPTKSRPDDRKARRKPGG